MQVRRLRVIQLSVRFVGESERCAGHLRLQLYRYVFVGESEGRCAGQKIKG